MVQIIIKRLQQITKSLSIVCAFIEAMGSDFSVMATIMQKKWRLRMDEKKNLTEKNISIKTTNGTVVNVTCSYAEDKTLEALFLSYLEQANAAKMAA